MMTDGWSWYVIILTLLNIFACLALLLWVRSKPAAGAAEETLGHSYDGIEELDTPLPRWWLWLFVGTIVFSLAYLVLYPGLGNFAGTLGWTSTAQHGQEVAQADARYGPIYRAYAAEPIPALTREPRAVVLGQRLFAGNCAQCHGVDARGGIGFPDLTDGDWLYGGEPETIEKTILDGRSGFMPPFAPALGGDAGVEQTVAYVLSLSGRPVDPVQAEAGKQKYMTICIACHGPEGKGNPAMGAPNLTDDVWLYGGTREAILDGLRRGHNGKMPAHRELLGAEKAHIVAAYVYSLSHHNHDHDDDEHRDDAHEARGE